MASPHAGRWIEWDLDEGPLTMLCPGWTEDRATLVEAVKQAGWFAMTWQAREAAEAASLSWCWVGMDEDGTMWTCGMDGWCAELGQQLGDVSQVTIAEVAS